MWLDVAVFNPAQHQMSWLAVMNWGTKAPAPRKLFNSKMPLPVGLKNRSCVRVSW
jgi:hypothetical protein